VDTIPCFLLAPTGRDAVWLRRYVPCKGVVDLKHLLHDAAVRIEDAAAGVEVPLPPPDDPRWPAACACGHVFGPDAVCQVFPLTLYAAPDGREYVVHPSPPPGAEAAPAGALFFSTWCPGPKKGPGPYLWAVLPNKAGTWCIDGESDEGPGWNRTGMPPVITVTPSINAGPRYHGHLQDGAFTMPGR
jgi:hypothetical protein